MSVEKDEHAEIIQFPTTLHVCFTFCMLTHYISFNIEAKCFENTTSMVNPEKSHQDEKHGESEKNPIKISPTKPFWAT